MPKPYLEKTKDTALCSALQWLRAGWQREQSHMLCPENAALQEVLEIVQQPDASASSALQKHSKDRSPFVYEA